MKWPWRNQTRTEIPQPSVLYLFPDTNFFMQCKPPEQLDWTMYSTYPEVHLLVCRPVQKEVDRLKNRGSDRLGGKARKTASLLRSIVLSDTKEFVARHKDPRVAIQLRMDLRAGRSPDSRLDMSETDDQLVAIAQAFARSAPDLAVRLLTADSGVMASANMLGLRLAEIPESWLLPPESDRNERTIRRLTDELARYKRAEPRFEIKPSRPGKTNNDGPIELEVIRYEPLEEEERRSLLDRVKQRFPEVCDFGPTEQEPRNTKPMGLMSVWEPVPESEKEEYRSRYADWLRAVDDYLRNYHQTLNATAEPASITIEIENVGSRPGKDALVEIKVIGSTFLLRVPPDPDDEEEDDGQTLPSQLPEPPAPPGGKWMVAFERAGKIHKMTDMARLSDTLQTAFGRGSHQPEFYSPSLDFAALGPPDPNRFYYKPERPTVATEAVTLECQQWRHSTEPEQFYIELQIPDGAEYVEGAMMVSVHAENLTEVVNCTIPVRLHHRSKSCLDHAVNCINELFANTSKE